MEDSSDPCAFCQIIARRRPATIVAEDELAVAFLDVRQFHPGHVLVVSRKHLPDLSAADELTAAAVSVMVACISRAVAVAFPADGMSIWHSAGEAANQEVPHLHFHVHPRYVADDLLRVYPQSPALPERAVLEDWGARIITALTKIS